MLLCEMKQINKSFVFPWVRKKTDLVFPITFGRHIIQLFDGCVVIILLLVMRKRDYCLCENKGADQLSSNCEADQRLCFRYSDSTIPLLLKSEISSVELFSELVQVGLCRTWSETPKTGFLTSRPILLLVMTMINLAF